MPYALHSFFGLGLIAMACAAIAYASHELLQIGTCASGPQPYSIERECPPGTERLVLAMFAAFVPLLVGAGLHSSRGRAPGAEREPATITLLLVWTGVFLGISFAMLWGVWGPNADPGGVAGVIGPAKGAAIGVGILFALMGLPAVAIIVSRLVQGGSSADGGAARSFQIPASHPPARDAVSEQDFERPKRQIIERDER